MSVYLYVLAKIIWSSSITQSKCMREYIKFIEMGRPCFIKWFDLLLVMFPALQTPFNIFQLYPIASGVFFSTIAKYKQRQGYKYIKYPSHIVIRHYIII